VGTACGRHRTSRAVRVPVLDLFGDPVCFLIDRCEFVLRKAFTWVSVIAALLTTRFRSRLSTELLGDDLARALCPSILRSEFGLRADALQLSFPGTNPLFLCQRQVREVLDHPVGVVRIHLRLLLLLDRRPEIRRLVNHLEAVIVTFRFAFVLVRLFIDRNFITEGLLT